MSIKNSPKNGGFKSGDSDLKDAELQFPVTFQLKAVMDQSSVNKENISNISSILQSLNITNQYINSKSSSKGTYTSYHFKVTLTSKPQLESLYSRLKELPGLKFAL